VSLRHATAEREVVVVGHADDPFVWRGDVQEFLEMWEVD
jgi:hypothetical protein